MLSLIKSLIKHPAETAKNTNFMAWSWWSASALISITYYMIAVKDVPTILIAISHFIGCFIVSIMVFIYRRRYEIPLTGH